MAEEEFDDSEIASPKLSKFNAAALINIMVTNLWKDSYRHSRAGELSKWNADLNCLWMEFAGDVEPESDEETEYKKIEKELAEEGNLVKPKATGFKARGEGESVNFAKQYRILMRKSIFIRRLQNKQGKGTAYYDDADDYMD